jgi:hypothetical protein
LADAEVDQKGWSGLNHSLIHPLGNNQMFSVEKKRERKKCRIVDE